MSKKQILIVITILMMCPQARSQEPSSQKVFYQLGSFRQALEGHDPVHDTYNILDKERKQQLQKTHNIDAETAEILNSLENPFISQIKKNEAPVTLQDEVFLSLDDEGIGEEVYEEISKPTFKISGLVWDTERPQAILDGAVYNMGDIVDSWTIVGISADGVEISFQNKIFLIEP